MKTAKQHNAELVGESELDEDCAKLAIDIRRMVKGYRREIKRKPKKKPERGHVRD